MPPQGPGDPAEGGADDRDPEVGDDHADVDDVAFRPPLPPEDRIWRHPSEVASGRPAVIAAPARPVRTASLMLLAGAAGATAALATVALVGGFDDRVVERQVAVQPSSAVDDADEGVAALAERSAPSVAALVVRRGDADSYGSAVVLRGDGHLVTDAAVVTGADEVQVLLHGGQVADAELVGADEATGIAVLRIDVDGLRPALMGTSETLAAGSRTVLVAATADGGWRPWVSSGVVAAVAGRVEAADGTARYGMIVVDRAFGAGAPGGALVDADGVVVGIATGVRPQGDQATGGVAMPIEVAEHVARQLIATGRVQHVWLGLHGRDLEAADAASMGTGGGALVEDVMAGGPAERVGIEPGDVVVSVGGVETPSMAALISALRLHVPGDRVVVRIWRDGEVREVDVELAAKA